MKGEKKQISIDQFYAEKIKDSKLKLDVDAGWEDFAEFESKPKKNPLWTIWRTIFLLSIGTIVLITVLAKYGISSSENEGQSDLSSANIEATHEFSVTEKDREKSVESMSLSDDKKHGFESHLAGKDVHKSEIEDNDEILTDHKSLHKKTKSSDQISARGENEAFTTSKDEKDRTQKLTDSKSSEYKNLELNAMTFPIDKADSEVLLLKDRIVSSSENNESLELENSEISNPEGLVIDHPTSSFFNEKLRQTFQISHINRRARLLSYPYRNVLMEMDTFDMDRYVQKQKAFSLFANIEGVFDGHTSNNGKINYYTVGFRYEFLSNLSIGMGYSNYIGYRPSTTGISGSRGGTEVINYGAFNVVENHIDGLQLGAQYKFGRFFIQSNVNLERSRIDSRIIYQEWRDEEGVLLRDHSFRKDYAPNYYISLDGMIGYNVVKFKRFDLGLYFRYSRSFKSPQYRLTYLDESIEDFEIPSIWNSRTRDQWEFWKTDSEFGGRNYILSFGLSLSYKLMI